jgi:hypothetical protein
VREIENIKGDRQKNSFLDEGYSSFPIYNTLLITRKLNPK